MLSPHAANILAMGVLIGMAGALAGYIVVLFRRSPLTPVQTVLYGWNMLMARVLWRATVSGPLPVPAHQGAVIICNHQGPMDSSFIAVTTRRLVRWMVAKEYCSHLLFKWFFRACEAIPVSRGGIDTAATKIAIRLAQSGHLVGLFPEGRINDTDKLLLPGRPGAAMIALKARVPVVPCYVSGSPYDGTYWGCLFMAAKVHLKVGRPIDISEFYGREDEREVLEHLTRLFLTEIARLAGHPDFQPELAGRFYKPGLVADD